MEGEGVVSEHVAQCWFQRFNIGKYNIKDLLGSERPKLWDIENILRVLEENPQNLLVCSQNNLVHKKIPYIALENDTEAVDLILMN